MTKGVIYFNIGVKCICRLIVSIKSLRKHYDGPVLVITDEESYEHLSKLELKILIQKFPDHLEGKNSVYLKKAFITNCTPYDLNIFLDADTLVVGNINELFELAEIHEFVVPQFTNWTTQTRQIRKRISGWESIYPKECDYLSHANELAVNCGVFAFKKDTKFAMEWCDKIIDGRNNFIPDETGMQVLLQNYEHLVCDQKYNVSCKYSNPHDPDARIIHYHGRKHCRVDINGSLIYGSELWVKEFNEAVEQNFMNINDYVKHDRMLKKYLSTNRNDEGEKSITIVTAVNPPYLEKLKTVLPTWQLKPQLKNCDLVVIHNGFENPEDELSFIKDISGRNVKLVEWKMEGCDSTRELMLSSFIYLAPKIVTTSHWLKLDADAYFNNTDDLILDHFYEYDIAGHKWKYTKPGQWICNLDDWAFDQDLPGNSYLSEEQSKEASISKRYGHRRIASYCCLHKTEFTLEVIDNIGQRLPVPSHDTLLWYMAERMPDRKWCWHSYKKLGCTNHTNLEELKNKVAEVVAKYEI